MKQYFIDVPDFTVERELAHKYMVKAVTIGQGLELGDGRYNMGMLARVNGEERSRGNFRDITYTFAQMIARASRDATLYPGDVLGSGTVGTGCLLELTAGQGPWLEPYDLVELEVAGLGILKNRVIP